MIDFLLRYWSEPTVAVNAIVFANLFGALLLGILVGYERNYHGRAAGMRTYGLVCMSSCAITVLAGYPNFWYGGHALGTSIMQVASDPTRVIQGIVTGIGFLGAGVIMRDGMNISGLTTAASIWSSSAIGILVGVGFYSAGILLAFLSIALMMTASKIEARLPSHHSISIFLRFKAGFVPHHDVLTRVARERGYKVLEGSFNVAFNEDRTEWRYIAVAKDQRNCISVTQLADELRLFPGIETFNISHARN